MDPELRLADRFLVDDHFHGLSLIRHVRDVVEAQVAVNRSTHLASTIVSDEMAA